ncbi:aminopeptidase N-like [Cataglyphis hispanica]|uniref:aminopeptidase N-like n=1 Tax=Cataglyphis hispanica TaxID=1086592 RepID=UPI002180370F|nr:aminopeptidase N-like [Cataglyphis hispanica]
MVFLKLLLNSCLTFIIAKAFFTHTHITMYKKHLNNVHNIISEHYNVHLVPDVELNTFYSECNISIKVLVPMQYLVLHSKIKCLTDIIMTDNPPRFRGDGVYKEMIVYPMKYFYSDTNENIKIIFINNLILPERYILNIKYVGIVDDNTQLTTIYKEKHDWWLMTTYFDILGARQIFPCWSEFSQTTFNITLKYHRDYVALSNMPIEKVEINNVDMAIAQFQTTPRMPIYFIGGIVTNFYCHSTKSTNVCYRNCSSSHMVFAQEAIEHITLSLESEWKYLREILKVNHGAIPNFPDKNKPNFGLVLYREEDIIYNNMLDSAARKIDVVRIIGYKVLQEWFYNVYNVYKVNSGSWTSYFFNDCLIRFLGTYTVHKIFPTFRIMDMFVVQFHHDLLNFDTSYKTSAFNSIFKFFRCIKVSIMMRMLQNIFPEKIFWKGIHTYIFNDDLDYKNLERAMSESIDDTYPSIINVYKSELLNMVNITNSWTKQKHYPTIIVKRDYDHPYSRMVLIENYHPSHHYCIPLTYTTQTDLDFNNTLPRYWLNQMEPHLIDIKFKENGWIIFNLQQIGYYRVNYDLENWKKIACYLASENYMKIHVLNRAQIIDDVFHFMITKQLNPATFWNITKYLKQETDFVAWYPMFKALEYMSSVFPFSGEKTDKIKNKILHLLNTVLEKLEYNEIHNEDDFRKRLRQEAAKWTCSLNDQICVRTAHHKLNQHLENPEKDKLLPWWKEWTYCNGFKLITNSLYYEKSTLLGIRNVYRIENKRFKNKFIEYLVCSEDQDFIINHLNFVADHMKLNYNLHNKNYIAFFLFAIARHANKNNVFHFIIDKFEKIKPKKISILVTLTVLVNHLYSEEHLQKVKEFLVENLKKLQNYTVKKIQENLLEPLDTILEINTKMITNLKKEEQEYKVVQDKIDIRSHQIESQKYLSKHLAS